MYIKNRSARSGARSARASGPDVDLRERPYASSAAFEVGADLITSRRRRLAVSGSLNAVVTAAHQGGRTIGDCGLELEPLARLEQMIEIIAGWAPSAAQNAKATASVLIAHRNCSE